MRQTVSALILMIALLSISAAAQLTPTTTLAAETGNNTSSQLTGTMSNNNIGPSNVSKVDVHTLLANGAATKIYVHLMPWFGANGHINVNYNSADPAQVSRQIADMESRGIQGVIIDWYGPGSPEDATTKVWFQQAASHPGFEIAVMVDNGATSRGSIQSLYQYVATTYFSSPNYMKVNGRPMITDFGVADANGGFDWAGLQASLPGNPILIFDNNGGFGLPASGGSYSWVMPQGNSSDWAQAYLDSFYQTGANSGKVTFSTAYKGFNDTAASWSANRIMDQGCGQVWLNTFNELNKYFGAGKPVPAMQIVTWNDYEEGTAVETGIDNCVSIKATANGSNVSWTTSGNENTLDHYTVYASTDGQNLAVVGDVAAGTHSIDVGSLLPAGSYSLYVKAVGKPMLTNHMSNAVQATSNGTGSTSVNGLSVSVSPTSLTVGQTATVTVNSSGGAVQLGCTGLPAGDTCSFSPATVNGSGTSKLVINRTMGALKHTNPLLPFTMAPAMGLVFAPMSRRRKLALALVVVAVFGVMLMTGCGSGGSKSASFGSSNSTAATNGTIVTITATGAGGQATTSVLLN